MPSVEYVGVDTKVSNNNARLLIEEETEYKGI